MERIVISPKILVWGGLGIISALLVWILKEVIVLFMFAFIFSAGLRPVVDTLEEQRKVPRIVSILGAYLLLFIFLFITGLLFANAILAQINDLVTNLPNLVGNLLNSFGFLGEDRINSIVTSIEKQVNELSLSNFQDVFGLLVDNLRNVGQTGLTVVGSIFNALVSFFVLLVTTAYLSLRKEPFYHGLLRFFKPNKSKEIKKSFERIEENLGSWLRGQLVIMLIIAVLSYIALILPLLFGVQEYDSLAKFALILAILAGILEALPNLGPALTAFIVVLFALATGQAVGVVIYIIISFVLIQQFEGLFIVPAVMNKAVDLDPLITVLGVIAGLEIYGVAGAILSVPVIVVLRISFEELRKLRTK